MSYGIGIIGGVGMSCGMARIYALLKQSEKDFEFFKRELQLSDNSSFDELTDNMEVKNMVQAQYSETFLKGESIIELGITKLKILDEGSYVKGNYGEQLQVRVLANDKEKKKFKWSLGAKVNDTLISLFGKDTSEWVGKEIEVATEQNKSGKPSVIVTSKPQGKLGV